MSISGIVIPGHLGPKPISHIVTFGMSSAEQIDVIAADVTLTVRVSDRFDMAVRVKDRADIDVRV